jgi:threonine dehydratase
MIIFKEVLTAKKQLQGIASAIPLTENLNLSDEYYATFYNRGRKKVLPLIC